MSPVARAIPGDVLTLDAWRSGGEFFTHRGHELFYRRGGSGPTVVLLHGFITSSWDWSLVWPALARRFDVVALDFLGFGYSAKPSGAEPRDYLSTGRADSLLALMEHLQVPRAHVVASSFSVSVAQELLLRQQHDAAQVPLDIASLCLTNGGWLPAFNRPKFGQRLLLSRWGPLVDRFIRPAILDSNLQSIMGQTRIPAQRMREYWRLLQHNAGHRVLHRTIGYLNERANTGEAWPQALTQATMPVRLIWGGHPNDTVSGRDMLEAYASMVANPDTVLLEDVGHYPHLESPERFVEHYVEFVGRVEERGGL